MAQAFILVNVSAGKVLDVLNAISDLKETKNVHVVSGPYDLVALLKAENFNVIASLVLEKIQSIDGVIATITCNVVKQEDK